jgi:hypothetical protein
LYTRHHKNGCYVIVRGGGFMFGIFEESRTRKFNRLEGFPMRENNIMRKLNFKRENQEPRKNLLKTFKNPFNVKSPSSKNVPMQGKHDFNIEHFISRDILDIKWKRDREKKEKIENFLKEIIRNDWIAMENKLLEIEKILEEMKKKINLKVQDERKKEQLEEIKKETFFSRIYNPTSYMERDGLEEVWKNLGFRDVINNGTLFQHKNDSMRNWYLLIRKNKKRYLLNDPSSACKNCEFRGSCGTRFERCGVFIHNEEPT